MPTNGPSIEAAPDLTTSAAVVGDHVVYEVRTSDAFYRDSLLHIGFHRDAETVFSRRLSVWGDVAAIHRRFAANLRTILLQSARRAPVYW